ncbi:MAG: peptidase C1, partial [Bacteroidetes bacterium]
MKKYWLLILALFSVSAYSQKKDKSVFKEYEPGFYQNFIMKDIRHVKAEMNKKDMERRFFMDHSGLELPNDPSLYKSYWHTPPISQGNTGTCWCFSTISMYESEVKRLTGQEIKLSEIYIVYWEYVEKARGFIQKRGNSNFAEGSEGNAVARIMNTHGLVPWDVY